MERNDALHQACLLHPDRGLRRRAGTLDRLVFAPVVVIGIHDLAQTKKAILRDFPQIRATWREASFSRTVASRTVLELSAACGVQDPRAITLERFLRVRATAASLGGRVSWKRTKPSLSTRTAPGLPTNPRIPLNFDAWTDLGLALAGTAIFDKFVGFLPASGKQTVTFQLPQSLAPQTAGTRLNFTTVLTKPGGGFDVMNPVTLRLLP